MGERSITRTRSSRVRVEGRAACRGPHWLPDASSTSIWISAYTRTLLTTYLTTYSVGVPCSVSVCALVSGCWCARGCAVCVILALVFESVSGD